MSSDRHQAIFLSYASQDAAAARRICDALRADGLEVWFDQNELVGGDAWDRKIRGQIRDCALFLPLISANTQARLEGYFRLEWKLAEDRSHLMAKGKPFLVPVAIDATSERDAHVPDAFLAVQWTRLPAGETPPAFVAHVQRLLGKSVPEPTPSRPARPGEVTASPPAPPVGRALRARRFGPGAIAAAVATLAIVGYFLITRQAPAPAEPAAQRSPQPTSEKSLSPIAPSPSPAAVTAVDKSLVVLPLENLSPDPENAFFTDGMHAEIISTLSRIPDLKVISRDSALALKGSNASLSEKAAKVGVTNVVTGSVRRDTRQIRIQLELRRARDESVLWQNRYEIPVEGDLLTLQSDIAEQVARLLQARNPKGTFASARFLTTNREAFERLMKVRRTYDTDIEVAASEDTIAELEAIIRLDPKFMPAADLLASAHCRAFERAQGYEKRSRHAAEARRWAETASTLVPGGAGDGALAHFYYRVEHDMPRSLAHASNLIRALPNEATGYNWAYLALSALGRYAEGLTALERALELDPINPVFLRNFVGALSARRREPETEAAISRLLAANDSRSAQSRILEARYELRGEITPPPEPNLTYYWRTRQFAEGEQLTTTRLEKAADPYLRFNLLINLATFRKWRGSVAESHAAAREALLLAQQIQALPEIGRSEKPGYLARAYAALDQPDLAVAHARKWIALASPETDASRRKHRELALAEIHSKLRQPRECVALLASLLRVPSGITVPMLKVDPTWDPVRDDPAFQALLADPKNSAPL